MKPQRLFWLLWLVLMLLNVLTATLMEIHADEAYYHLFGQYLAWGYYDHPPMVGLLAAIGNGCGFLRLMPILLQGVTIWLIWQIVIDQRPVTTQLVWNFYMVVGGMTMWLTTGFLLTPDAPLMLFVALFFFAYQQYQKQSSWLWALVLGASMAGMVYSKYMGVLVVVFTLLSNPRVVKDGKMWCAVGLAVVLMLPHLHWLYTHDWATVQFNLIDRHKGFSWRAVWEYWPKQLVVFNPLALGLMIGASVKVLRERPVQRFKAALGVTVLGFLSFFWLMSLKGHVEPHWTMAASVPAIVLMMNISYRRWMRITLWIMAGLCLAARVVLCANCLPYRTYLAQKYPQYEQWHQKAGKRVVVTVGSFQDASLYRYWQGEAILTHDLRGRHTQYELLDVDWKYQGQEAMIVRGKEMVYVDRLQLTDRIQIVEEKIVVKGDRVEGKVIVRNPYAVDFEWNHAQLPVEMQLAWKKNKQWHFVPCQIEGAPKIAAQGEEEYTIKACVKGIEQDAWIYALHTSIATTGGVKCHHGR